MQLQDKLKEYFKENGIQMKWFAEKIGLNKSQLYQVVAGTIPLPRKCWVQVIKMTKGKITLCDILEYSLSDIKEIEFKGHQHVDRCEVSLKDFNIDT